MSNSQTTESSSRTVEAARTSTTSTSDSSSTESVELSVEIVGGEVTSPASQSTPGVPPGSPSTSPIDSPVSESSDSADSQGGDPEPSSVEDLPKMKRQLEGDFVLKRNLVTSAQAAEIALEFDQSRFKVFRGPVPGLMSNLFIHIPLEHFRSGLSLPLDPAFCELLRLTKSQPAHVHPNGVRYFVALTVLCRRIGVEISELILRTFFSILRNNNLSFSLRPRQNVVTLFEAPPNKLGRWNERWVCAESTTGFPFYPKCKSLRAWGTVNKRTKYSDSDRKFLDFIDSELGRNPATQTKIFLTSELLAPESLRWCGIGGKSVEPRRRELGMEDTSEYPVWVLHPGRELFDQCPECPDLSLPGCPVASGR